MPTQTAQVRSTVIRKVGQTAMVCDGPMEEPRGHDFNRRNS
jgi:hypothetical protein